MVQSAVHLQRQDLGFTPHGLIKGQVGLRQASYPDAPSDSSFSTGRWRPCGTRLVWTGWAW